LGNVSPITSRGEGETDGARAVMPMDEAIFMDEIVK